MSENSSIAYRLPTHFQQREIEVALDLRALDPASVEPQAPFSGRVSIVGELRESANEILLHGRDLEVAEASASTESGTLPASVSYDETQERLSLQFAQPLPKGPLRLQLVYRGRLQTNMHGLYLGVDGQERALVSQCQATDARAIFPCMDEPAHKIRLAWQVRAPIGLDVLANGPRLEVTSHDDGSVTHPFGFTHWMPTYLAALTVGRYEKTATEALGQKEIPAQIWTGRNQLPQAAYAEAVTRFVVPAYEDYFGTPFPYQTLVQVAVPGFDAGAMENVGAIFYRQTALLVQPGKASIKAVRRVAEVVAHEIAHQWFGNEVTPKWWDDLWLNEAFATWISHKVVDKMDPSLRMWDVLLGAKESALQMDALDNTHPIYTEVKTPAEAVENFDLITYEKGSSVLRMMELYLGENAWRKGVAAYTKEFGGKNAEGADLWRAIGAEAGVAVDAMVKTWVESAGFPLVRVRTEDVDGVSVLHLSQQRFSAGYQEKSSADSLWPIPLSVVYGVEGQVKTHRLVFDSRESTVSLPEQADWVYPNEASAGVYRMAFESEDHHKLINNLAMLSAGERMGLLHDTWALVKNGSAPVARVLELVEALGNEDDVMVMGAISEVVTELNDSLVNDSTAEAFQRMLSEVFSSSLKEIGFGGADDEDADRREYRATLIGLLGKVAKNSAVLESARSLAAKERSDPGQVEANLGDVVVSLAAMGADEVRQTRDFEEYRQRKSSGMSPQLQNRYLYAVARYDFEGAVERVMAWMHEGSIPQEQVMPMLRILLRQRETQAAAWRELRQHWLWLHEKAGDMGIARVIGALETLPATELPAIKAFFAEHPVPQASRTLKQSLETIATRARFYEAQAPVLAAWLADRA